MKVNQIPQGWFPASAASARGSVAQRTAEAIASVEREKAPQTAPTEVTRVGRDAGIRVEDRGGIVETTAFNGQTK